MKKYTLYCLLFLLLPLAPAAAQTPNYYLLARQALQEGDQRKAVIFYTKSIERGDEYRYLSYLGRAYRYYYLKRYEAARADVLKAMEMPTTTEEYEWSMGHAHLLLGSLYSKEKDLPNALREYTQAHQFLPEDAVLLNNIGYDLLKLGKLEHSIHYLTLAIEQDADFAYSYNNRAEAYLRLDRLEEAWEDLEKSKVKEPGNPVLLKNYGLYFLKTGQREEACRYFHGANQDDKRDTWFYDDYQRLQSLIQENCSTK
ncbi:MAG: hypothetical protein AAFW73_06900 [Bacteroidota bacterium]